MNTVQRIAKNILTLYAGNIVIRVLNLVLFVYIARYLHATGLGQYSFILAFVALFGIIHEFGYYSVISREVAKERNQASVYLSNVIFIKVGLIAISFFLIIFSINFLGYPQEIKNLVYMYTITTFFISFSAPFRAIFVAYEKLEYEAVVTLVERVLVVPLSIAALLLGYGLKGLIIVLLISGAIEFFLSVIIVHKKITKLKFEIDLKFCKELVVMAIPFVFLGVFNTIYHSVDIVMLSKIAGDAATGWYSASYRLISALLFIPALFMGALFPVMSRFFASSRDSLVFAYRTSFKFLLILALPTAVGVTLLADRIIIRIYGDLFFNSILVLQILAWTMGLMFLNNVFFITLMSINKEKTTTKIVAFGVTLNVILNLILIPRFLHIGASVATLAAETVFFVLAFYSIGKSLHKPPAHKLVIKPIVASLAMATFVLYSGEILTFFIIIPLAAVLYFVVLLILKEFSEEDFELLRKIKINS